MTFGCGGVGFLDDFIKLRHKRSLGLSGRWKLLLLGAISAVLGYAANREGLDSHIYIPAIGTIDIWWFWYVLIFLVVAGAANGVNLTDGIDGLAAGTGIIALITFTAICIFTFIRLRQVHQPNLVYLDMAILGGGARRRRDRVPLVQRVPRGRVHGRHRLDGHRRRARRVRGDDEDRAAAAADRRHLPDRGALA